MKKLSVVAGLVVALALPASAVAKPSVDREDMRVAFSACKAERGKTTDSRRAFKDKWHSMARCTGVVAKSEAKAEEAIAKNASKECKAEAEMTDEDFAVLHPGETFESFYGTGKAGRNAHGKCVSMKVREDNETRTNAAKECKAEARDEDFASSHDDKSFSEYYGTNANHRNAYGKCVSGKVREAEEEEQEAPEGETAS
jgi:hypothetical protein